MFCQDILLRRRQPMGYTPKFNTGLVLYLLVFHRNKTPAGIAQTSPHDTVTMAGNGVLHHSTRIEIRLSTTCMFVAVLQKTVLHIL